MTNVLDEFAEYKRRAVELDERRQEQIRRQRDSIDRLLGRLQRIRDWAESQPDAVCDGGPACQFAGTEPLTGLMNILDGLDVAPADEAEKASG